MALINFILRQFFKAVEEDPFVIVQVRNAITIQGLSRNESSTLPGILSEKSGAMEAILELGTGAKRS